jgi:hypothetical protein
MRKVIGQRVTSRRILRPDPHEGCTARQATGGLAELLYAFHPNATTNGTDQDLGWPNLPLGANTMPAIGVESEPEKVCAITDQSDVATAKDSGHDLIIVVVLE